MEVVGALASSAQLAAYVVKSAAFLSDLYERLKNAPDRIQQDANHIKRLIEIILHIKETRSLHTTLVFAQLEYTISQAYSLRDLLVKVLGQYTQPSFRRRYWKLLKGKKEKQILLALQSLEREKTGLSLCLTAAQIEFLHDVRGEVRKAESNMPEQGSPKLPREQILSGQTYHLCPPSPAPTAPDSEQAESNETQDMESSHMGMADADRSDTIDDQKKKAGVLGSVDIDVDEPTSSKQARQNNGVYAPGPVVAKIRVKKPKAEDTSIQNNGFAGFETFWSRSQEEADT